MPENNLVFLFEDASFKLARYLRRVFGKKTGCDEKSLILLHRALRHTLSFYKDLDKDSALVGIDFSVVVKSDKTPVVCAFLILNDQRMIEVKNKDLTEAITQMFGQRLVKNGKVFFHWKMIENFEEQVYASQQEEV